MYRKNRVGCDIYVRMIVHIYLLFVICSCSSVKNEALETALTFAGDNRTELEKVLTHYENDSLKLKAAIYLIESMPFHYSYSGSELDSFKMALDQYVDSGAYDKRFKYLERFPYEKLTKEYDAKVITSDYLIENIEYSFKVWRETPWGKHVSFEDFCEFILPYRIKDEPLTHWKKELYHKFKPILDSLYQGNDPVEAVSCLSRNFQDWHYQNTMNGPHLSALYLVEQRVGNCVGMADYGCYLMRSVGIPTAIDTYIWSPVRHVSHTWNAVLDTTGYTIPFNWGNKSVKREGTFGNKKGKVYRHCYSWQQDRFASVVQNRKYHISLSDFCMKDVSADYFPANEIKVDCDLIKEKNKDYDVWIGVFNKWEWLPIGEGSYKNGQVTFRDIEEGPIYMVLYGDNGKLKEASYPFKIDNGSGGLLYYRPEGDNSKMTLRRKWPLTPGIKSYIECITYGRFEGANRKDFSDAKVLHQIKYYPQRMLNTITLDNTDSYRYVRYISTDWMPCNIAEVAWYADKKGTVKLQGEPMSTAPDKGINKNRAGNAMDGDPLTFFASAGHPGWVGLDLKTPRSIKCITYVPRNDNNFISPGDEYELYYFSADGWKSLGKRVAYRQILVYKNAPRHALFWLHNLTKGVEEQVFTYSDDKQFFADGYLNLLF